MRGQVAGPQFNCRLESGELGILARTGRQALTSMRAGHSMVKRKQRLQLVLSMRGQPTSKGVSMARDKVKELEVAGSWRFGNDQQTSNRDKRLWGSFGAKQLLSWRSTVKRVDGCCPSSRSRRGQLDHLQSQRVFDPPAHAFNHRDITLRVSGIRD